MTLIDIADNMLDSFTVNNKRIILDVALSSFVKEQKLNEELKKLVNKVSKLNASDVCIPLGNMQVNAYLSNNIIMLCLAI